MLRSITLILIIWNFQWLQRTQWRSCHCRTRNKGVRLAKRSEEGKDQEGTQDEPEGRKGLEGRGVGGLWVGVTTASHSDVPTLYWSVPGPDSPQIAKFPLRFCVEQWGGLCGSAGEWKSWLLPCRWLVSRKHTHSTFPFAGQSAASGVGNWKISSKVNIYLEIRRYIAKHAVKGVIPGKKEHEKGSRDYCFGACVSLYYIYIF